MRKTKKTLAILAIVAMVFTMIPMQVFAADPFPTRISGTTQYDTAAQIADQGWASSSSAVLAAGMTGKTLVDALAAGPLAATLNIPILLTEGNALTQAAAAELTKLNVTKVYVTSGTAVIKQAVLDALAAKNITVVALGGIDAAATSVNIAKEIAKTAPVTKVVLAGGSGADALSVASIAGAKKMPILYTDNAAALPASVKAYLATLTLTNSYVIGGTAVVSDAQKAELSATAVRYAGESAYDTNLAVITGFSADINYANVFVANGGTLVDALAGAPLAAAKRAAIVLTDGSSTTAAGFVKGKLTGSSVVTALGGTVAVPAAALSGVAYTAPGSLQVSSISAINAKQLQIVFNKEVDRDSVINFSDDANNYNDPIQNNVLTISRTTLAVNPDTLQNAVATNANGMLSTDGLSLTVTLNPGDNTYFKGTYAVTLSDKVLAKDGTRMAPYSTVITVDDSTVPTVISVKYKASTGAIVVDFSEPLKVQPGVVRQDGSAATGVAMTHNNAELTFTNAAEKGATSQIYVALGEDYAGNVQTAYTGSLTIPSDSSALEVSSLTQTGSNQVTFVFNKAIEGANAAAAQTELQQNLKILVGSQIYSYNSNATTFTVARDTDDSTKFKVTFVMTGVDTDYDFGFYGGDATKAVTFMIDKDAIKDVFGNTNAGFTQSLTLTKDKVAPTVSSVKEAATEDTFQVTFNEKISNINGAKVHLRQDGVEIAFASALKSSTDSKILVITPNGAQIDSGKIKNANYTIYLEKGAVQDLYGNDVSAYTSSTIAVTANSNSTTTSLKAAITQLNATNNQFQVAYTKDNNAQQVTASALDLNNYRLDGAVLPTGTDIYFTTATKDTVIIKLPASSINYGDAVNGTNAQLTVMNVKDVDGVTVTTKSDIVTVADNTKSTLQSASLVGNMLTLNFDENVGSVTNYNLAQFVADFEVKTGTTTLNAGINGSAVFSVDGKKLYLTIVAGDSNWSTVKSGNAITMKTIENGTTGKVTTLKDADNLLVKSGVTVTVSK